MNRAPYCLAFALLVLGFPSLVFAQPVLTITVDDGQGVVTLTPQGTPVGDGTFDFDGTHTEPGRWSLIYPININPDPHFRNFHGSWYDFTSMGSSTQDFSLSFSATVDRSYVSPLRLEGDVNIGLDNPSPGDAVGADSNNSPVATMNIDGQNVAQLLRGFNGVSGSDSVSETFGPTLSPVDVNNTIGLQFDFSLTPGATAALNANFTVTEVPEPTAGLLVLLGLLPAASWRGRWKSPTG